MLVFATSLDIWSNHSNHLWTYLVSGGRREDEGGKDRQLVLGVQRPALHSDAHRQTEDRHRLRKRERLQVLLWVPADQTCRTQKSESADAGEDLSAS